MTYAVWNLGGGVAVGIEAVNPTMGPVERLSAAQLHRLALYVQMEIDIAQHDEACPPAPSPEWSKDPTTALSQAQYRVQHEPVMDELERQIRADAGPAYPPVATARYCGAPREMGNKVRHCDLPVGHGGDVHSVTLDELGGGSSQWPVEAVTQSEPEKLYEPTLADALGFPSIADAPALDPAVPLFSPHDSGLPPPPDPTRLVKKRESEQQKRDALLAAGWTEHREIYDQNIAACWENGGRWVDVHKAYEQMLASCARRQLSDLGWNQVMGVDDVERWVRPGGDVNVHNEAALPFHHALQQIGVDTSFIDPVRKPIDRDR